MQISFVTGPTCPSLKDIDYGSYSVVGGYYDGAIATYTCDDHYELVGKATLRCHGGIWIGVLPSCRRKIVQST